MKKVKVILTNVDTGQEHHFDSVTEAVRFLHPFTEDNYFHYCKGNKYVQADTLEKFKVSYPERSPKKDIVHFQKPVSLCNKCGRNILECDWLQSFTPIKGWLAELVPYGVNDLTYHVIECPLFEPFKKKE